MHQSRLWQRLARRRRKVAAHIDAHCLNGFQRLWRQRRKEQVGRLAIVAFHHFEHPPRVQIGQQRHIALALCAKLFSSIPT